jgi:hypothetical protein
MTNSETNNVALGASDRAAFAVYQSDLPSIARQLRLCRSTLGAVLEELECGQRSPTFYEEIGEYATSVTAEIEHLWECLKRSQLPTADTIPLK